MLLYTFGPMILADWRIAVLLVVGIVGFSALRLGNKESKQTAHRRSSLPRQVNVPSSHRHRDKTQRQDTETETDADADTGTDTDTHIQRGMHDHT